jgi:hypothetical protein
MTFQIGDIVTHAEKFHRRGASKGAIEAITEQGWYQVFWEEDDLQIHPAARTFEPHELKLCEIIETTIPSQGKPGLISKVPNIRSLP